MLDEGVQSLRDLLQAIWLGLTLHPETYAVVTTSPSAAPVILTLAVLAGASRLLGHSVVLFLNRVTPARFLASLGFNGVVFAAELAA